MILSLSEKVYIAGRSSYPIGDMAFVGQWRPTLFLTLRMTAFTRLWVQRARLARTLYQTIDLTVFSGHPVFVTTFYTYPEPTQVEAEVEALPWPQGDVAK